MIDRDRRNVLGVMINAVDQEAATEHVIRAAGETRPLGVSALAVHGLMSSVLDEELRQRVNGLDLVVPDGQPVRWALNWLHKARLPQRVYGPELMLNVCRRAAEEGLGIFLFGSQASTLEELSKQLRLRFPGLRICGAQPSRFRNATEEERLGDIRTIRESGARIVFVGLGCPRQEIWVYENCRELSLPALAVGAAFDYHSGGLTKPPTWMQNVGLEWLYRLGQEPGRLWRRYLYLNPTYLFLLGLQLVGLRRFPVDPPSRSLPMARPG